MAQVACGRRKVVETVTETPAPGGGAVRVTGIAYDDAVFTTVGNSSSAIENGNVVRYSAWMRNDPLDPITIDYQF